MNIIERIKKIENKFLSKNPPDIHVVTIEKFKGESKEKAVNRYEKENNIKESTLDNYIYILIPSDEQIREQLSRGCKL